MNILVTGGAGYIGSHACLSLLESGYTPIVIDNLSNSSEESLRRVQDITGKEIIFVQGDILDLSCLSQIFKDHDIKAVMHFAGLKSVGESVAMPRQYYQNNVSGTLNLIEAMEVAGCKNLVFSSSATVYGDPESVPITEDMPTGATTNPYGRSKYIVEEMLRDLYDSDDSWNLGVLRYFNPVGAHLSGRIGEDPKDTPNNLMPYISQVAVGKREQLSVFGSDYPTRDGTGVRDYIHVMDLVEGHVAMLDKLCQGCGLKIYNLGTGNGVSVLELVKAFAEGNDVSVPYEIAPRRAGDIAECFASPALSEKELGWKARRNLRDMVEDSWRWQSNNPEGYKA
ncbi:MAG: UDP-glucose 4-epimerase GalE [Cellvibrionaceae bacterium]